MALQLVIGNKNYSSWSLRPWLLLQHFGIPFSEIQVPLFTPGYEDLLRRYSPSLKVPVLIDEELTVWESLAICEYINEEYLDGRALPSMREARALCRAYCHEMHAGFSAIRSELPMNCRARREVDFSAAVRRECARIESLWRRARRRFVDHGDFLFGQFSLADCMYAPVVMRFHTYGMRLGIEAGAYARALRELPAMQRWCKAATREAQRLETFEIGRELPA
ncbi:MAG: glutathione S-transferase family protein [Pseudohongiellaceae bacterium]